jgi:hypothetical protein
MFRRLDIRSIVKAVLGVGLLGFGIIANSLAQNAYGNPCRTWYGGCKGINTSCTASDGGGGCCYDCSCLGVNDSCPG